MVKNIAVINKHRFIFKSWNIGSIQKPDCSILFVLSPSRIESDVPRLNVTSFGHPWVSDYNKRTTLHCRSTTSVCLYMIILYKNAIAFNECWGTCYFIVRSLT